MGRLLEIANRHSSPVSVRENEINEKYEISPRLPGPPQYGPTAWLPADGQIPARAILQAPRYCGDLRALEEVPRCWCCQTEYRLDHCKDWQEKTYALLAPGCGCLDAPQALACCGLCTEHCRCRKK